MADKLADAMASFERGSRNVARGVLDVAQFPSYLLNQTVGSANLAGKLATGIDALAATGLDKYLGFDAYARQQKAADDAVLNYDPADETFIDRGVRIASGALIPVPAASVAPGIKNLSQAPTLSRIAEVLIPGTPVPGASVGTLAANALVPVGIDAGIQAAFGPEKDDGIELVDTIESAPDNSGIELVETVDTSDVETVETLASPEEDNMAWGLLLAGGVAAGIGALVARRSANLGKFARDVETSPDKVATLQSGLKNVIYDDKAAAIDRLRELNRDDVIDAIRTTIPTQAMGSRVIESLHSGQFINSDMRLTRPDGTKFSVANLIGAIPKLSGDKQREFERLMRLSDDMDRVRNGLPTASGIQDIGVLSSEVASLRNDPMLARLQDDYLLSFRKTLEWAVEQGYVSRESFTGLITNQPAYTPAVPMRKSGIMDQIIETLLPQESRDSIYDTLRFMTERQLDGSEPISNLLSAPQALELYYSAMSTAVTRNKVLRDTLRALEETPWVTRLDSKPSNMDGVSAIKDMGNTVYYQVNAPDLRAALDFTPERLNKVVTGLNQSRKLAQAAATGTALDLVSIALTGVPLFLAKGMGYEAAMTTLLRPNMGGGALDQLKELGKDAVRLPTAPITATGRVLNSELARIWSGTLQSSYLAQTGPYKLLTSVFDPATVQLWHRNAFENYLNSTMRMYNRGGGGFAAYTDVGDVDNIKSLLTTTMPRYSAWAAKESGGRVAAASSAMSGAYKIASSVHNTAQNAWRIEFMAQHYKPGMSEKEFNKLMRQAGELSGDFRQKGSEHVLRTSVPYWNVMAQSTRQIMNMTKDHPVRMGALLTSMAGSALASIAYMTWNDPEFRELYWNRMTPAQRTQGLVYPDPNNADGYGYMFSWPNEIGGLIGMMTETMADTLGMKTGEFYQNPDMFEALTGFKLDIQKPNDLRMAWREGVTRFVGREGPLGAPVLQAGAALTGSQIDVPGALIEGKSPFRPLSTDQDVIGQEVKAQGDYLSSLTTEVIDAQFTQLGSLAIAFANGANASYGETGTSRGVQEMRKELRKRQSRSVPFMADEQQLSTWTASSLPMFKKKEAFNNLLEIDKQKMDQYTRQQYNNYPSELKALATQATQIKSAHEFNSRMLNKYKKDLALARRDNAPTEELNDRAKDVQDLQDQMLRWYEEFEYLVRDRHKMEGFRLEDLGGMMQK